jgi:PAS domain S-box-containing protein
MTHTPPRGTPGSDNRQPARDGVDGADPLSPHASRVEEEEELRRSEERFRLLVETVRDYAIFMLDPDGNIATWNAGAERIKGYRASEIIGRHFSVFYPPSKVAEGFPQHELAVAAREGRFEDEGWRVRKDGSQFWANVVITALHDRSGELVGFAKVTRDLTERRAAEEQGRRLAAEAAARTESERRNKELQRLTDQLQEQAIEIEAQKEEAQSIAEQFEQANAELELARNRLTQIFQQAPVAVAVLRGRVASELEYQLINPRYAEHIPTARAPLGRRYADVLPELGPARLAILQQVLDTGKPFLAMEYPASFDRDGDGIAETHYFNFVYHPLFETSGEVSGIVAVGTEVTESVRARKSAEDLRRAADAAREAAVSAERRVAQLYESVQSALRRAVGLQRVSSALVGALSETDVARIVVTYGREAVGAAAGSFALLDDERVFQILATEGYDAATSAQFQSFPLVAGRPVSDAVLNDAPLYQSSLAVLDAQYPHIGPVLHDTGLEAYVALPVRADMRPVGALSFSFAEEREFDAEDRAFLETLAAQAGQALDRARLVEAERAARTEAEVARSAAEEANRAKSEFLATMSHELRTPLNAIAGYADLLEMGLHGPITPDQRESLLRIRRSQMHLTGLINEVLNYARLESGMVTYDIRSLLVADVVATVLPLIEPQRAAKHIRLDVRLPEGAGQPPIHVLADRDKLQQIVLNLLSNAIKFTPENGRVEVALMPAPHDDGMALLRVVDTGIGIPSDKLEAIFEPFVQVGRSLRNPGEGTGLGLAISRDLARAMGGDITAASEVGHGATFTVTLPASRDSWNS